MASPGLRTTPWWNEKDPRTVASAVYAVVSGVEASYAQPRARGLLFASFAAGRPFGDLHFGYGYSMGGRGAMAGTSFDPLFSAPSQNVIRVCIQTLESTIGASQPFVNFLTDGADFKRQCEARRATKFVDAVYEGADVYKETAQCFRDELVFGTMYAKVWKCSDGSIGVRRRMPDCIWVDPADGYEGRPRSIYDRDFISAEVLCDEYPKFADDIMKAQAPSPFLMTSAGNRNYSDMRCLVEAYHLGVGDKPGRHVISIGDVLIYDRPWKHTWLPYAVGRFNRLHSGWWGQGLVEQLLPQQVELDYLCRNISDAHHRIGHPYIVNPIAGGVPADHFDDRNARIIEPANLEQAPLYMVPPVMPGESYAYRDSLIAGMFKEAGISEMAAQALAPKGLKSGEALREYADQASMRFQKLGKDFETFHEDIARLIVLTADAEGGIIQRPGSTLRWADVSFDTSTMVKAYPVSTLPFTPAARKEQIEEDFAKGAMSFDDYLRLRNNPDLGRWSSEVTAARVLIEQQLDAICETGVFQAPSKLQDLQTAIKVGVQRWNLGAQNVNGKQRMDQRTLALLSRYVDAATALLPKAPAPAPMLPASAPVASLVPQGAPLAPAAPIAAPMAA